uniref:U1756h n=1 Tax=Mycobacterium leprae TaxID=1769 RepID=Q49950_MYCLR|nr:u1756h [Mycobacterium leprae]
MAQRALATRDPAALTAVSAKLAAIGIISVAAVAVAERLPDADHGRPKISRRGIDATYPQQR